MKIALILGLSVSIFFAMQNMNKTQYITEENCKKLEGTYTENVQNNPFKNDYKMNIECKNIVN